MPNRKQVTRGEVIQHVRKFLGTPWRHQTHDCLFPVIEVNRYFGLTPFTGSGPYALWPPPGRLRAMLERYLTPVPRPHWPPENLNVADVAIFQLGRHPIHVGVIANGAAPFSMIHSYANLGRMVEHVIDDKWGRRIAFVYRFEGLLDG